MTQVGKAFLALGALVVVAYLGKIAFDYASTQPHEVISGNCILPAIYHGKSQDEINLVVSQAELKFSTKSGSVDLPTSQPQELMLVAEFMSCQYEKRNPNLTEEQRACYRAFILSSSSPTQKNVYDRCLTQDVFSRHFGGLKALAENLARTPNSKILLDLDSRSEQFRTGEILAADDVQLVQKLCDLNREKLECSKDGIVAKIRLRSP